MIKDVLQIGDPLLLERSLEITDDAFNSEQLKILIVDMVDTMHETGGVGFSAIQIGVKKRIAVIEYGLDKDHPRYKEIGECPLTIVINPEIKTIGAETSEYNEGCLSVVGERGDVLRPKTIEYKYYDLEGNLITGQSDNFFARVIQHEIDHMDGILFPMRIEKNNLKEMNSNA
jgi:peptide deformylase